MGGMKGGYRRFLRCSGVSREYARQMYSQHTIHTIAYPLNM